MSRQRLIERVTVIEATSLSGRTIRASGHTPHKQAVDMTAPEMFAEVQETLDKGRRPDRTGYALSDLGPLLCLGFGPGFCGRRVRPSLCSAAAMKAASPIGRPLPASAAKASIAPSASGDGSRSSAKRGASSSAGATLTRPSSRPARCARTLDHGQSAGAAHSFARTGLSAR